MNTTYRLKVWYLLLNIIVASVTLSSLAIVVLVLLFILALVVFSLQKGQTGNAIPLAAFGGVWGLFAGLMAFLGIILPLGNALFSYLQIGSTGLELRIWPFYRLRYGWHQVLGVECAKILGGRLSLPMLRIKASETESGPGTSRQSWANDVPVIHTHGKDSLFLLPMLLMAYLVWSVKSQNLIPVYLFNGWPNGKLRQDLERRLGPVPSN